MPCWIHRGACAGAQKVVLSQDVSQIIKYIEKRINQLKAQNIKMVCVFDGKKLLGPVSHHHYYYTKLIQPL